MKPVITVDEEQDGTRVRVTVGSADVWIRATPGGRRLDVAIDEGRGEVNVDWSIRRTLTHEPIVQTGRFVHLALVPLAHGGLDEHPRDSRIVATLVANPHPPRTSEA